MELEQALLLRHLPLVSTAEYRTDIFSANNLLESLAASINFARAARGIAQLVLLDAEGGALAENIEEQLNLYLDALQIEGERLSAQVELIEEVRARGGAFKVTITSKS